MNKTGLGMAAVAVILALIAYIQGGFPLLASSFSIAGQTLLRIFPILIVAFIVAGLVSILVPKEMVSKWLGKEAGWKGLIIGPAIGVLIQGGPFAFFPLFDSVFRDNETIGTAVAMITAWGVINVGHLPYELTFLWPRFVALKYSIYIAIPSLVGLLANLLFG